MSKSFTLIELLLVISIALIIVSLLQPALMKTLARSEQVQCGNHLKQVGAMSSLFIEDNNGKFTPDMHNWGPAYWIPTLMNNYGDRTFVHRNFDPIGTFFECPSARKEDDTVRYLQGGIGYNHQAGAIADQERWIDRLGSTDTTRHIDEISKPSETVLFGDDIDSGYQAVGYHHARLLNYNYASRYQGKGEIGALGARGRHQLYANYFWIDGHVESLTWNEFITEGQAKGSYDWYLSMSK